MQSQKIAFFLSLRVKTMFKKISAVAGLSAVGVSAANAAVDLTEITAAGADVALAGAAVLAVYVGIKAFKWIRGAL